MLTIALVGKTNVGKTTFFNAATLLDAKVSNYSFTTTEPNIGIAYASDVCVCRELGLRDNPQESSCIDWVEIRPNKADRHPGTHQRRQQRTRPWEQVPLSNRAG